MADSSVYNLLNPLALTQTQQILYINTAAHKNLYIYLGSLLALNFLAPL